MRCVVLVFPKVPKDQCNILRPKMNQIVRNFSATFPFFCATSATNLVQILDFLSATFWGGDYLILLHLHSVYDLAFGRLQLLHLLPNDDFIANCSMYSSVKRSFPVVGADLWNELPSDMTSAPSLPVFRQRLKTFLFQRSYPGIVV